jgi:hypothetical protein
VAPVGAAGYVFVAALFVSAIFLGACSGAGVWAVRGSVAWGGLLAAAGFLVATVVLGPYRFNRAAAFGLPIVLLTFLTSWLSAGYAGTRLSRTWATLVGLVCGLVVGFLALSAFGLEFVMLASVAWAADVCLVALLVFRRRTRIGVGR